jgi:hypothetical protein
LAAPDTSPSSPVTAPVASGILFIILAAKKLAAVMLFIIPITVIPAVLTALIIDVKLLILPVSSEVVIP